LAAIPRQHCKIKRLTTVLVLHEVTALDTESERLIENAPADRPAPLNQQFRQDDLLVH